MQKRVNILIAAYNGEKYIKEQIQSILDQTYDNIKIYINDDGSTDNTLSVIKEINSDKIVSITSQKCGSARANFQFLINLVSEQEVDGYFMFSDQDDYWLSNKVETEVKALEKLEEEYGDQSLLEVYSNYYVSGSRLNNKTIVYQHEMKADFEHLVIQNWIMGCTMIINGALLRYGRSIPVESENHDRWLSILASLYGHIGYISAPLMVHRIHSHNVTTQSDTTSIKNRLKRIKRRYSVTELRTFREKNIKLYKELESIHLKQQFPLWRFKMVALQHGVKSFEAYKKYNFQGVDRLQTTLFGMQFLLS